MMGSDIQAGDLVQVISGAFCAFGITHDDDEGTGFVGIVEELTGHDPRFPGIPEWCRLANYPFSESGEVCLGCVRKLNDEPDNAELIERIRKCKPIKVGQDA